MFQNISTILIWSSNWKKLAKWYEDTLNLKMVEEITHPKDTGRLFEFPGGKPWIWIGQHSKVKDRNKDKHRHMFNITTDSVDKTYEYLLKKKVKIIAKPFKAPTFDKWFCTFEDADGNLLQVIGPK